MASGHLHVTACAVYTWPCGGLQLGAWGSIGSIGHWRRVSRRNIVGPPFKPHSATNGHRRHESSAGISIHILPLRISSIAVRLRELQNAEKTCNKSGRLSLRLVLNRRVFDRQTLLGRSLVASIWRGVSQQIPQQVACDCPGTLRRRSPAQQFGFVLYATNSD